MLLRFDRDAPASGDEPARSPSGSSTALLGGARARRRLFPLLWMLSVVVHAGRARRPRCRRRSCRRAPTLENYRSLFGSVGMGRYLLNSLLIAALRHR